MVRLKDPNRITSINQYRLPYKLKEVAINYVQKLIEAGVIRKSTSVFNSPLMLVKKPNADPKKQIGEQYRLVRNYVDLNKNINLVAIHSATYMNYWMRLHQEKFSLFWT